MSNIGLDMKALMRASISEQITLTRESGAAELGSGAKSTGDIASSLFNSGELGGGFCKGNGAGIGNPFMAFAAGVLVGKELARDINGTPSTDAANGTTPTDATNGTTPTDAANGTTPTDAANGTTPTDATNGTTPAENTDDTTAANCQNGSTQNADQQGGNFLQQISQALQPLMKLLQPLLQMVSSMLPGLGSLFGGLSK